MHEKLIFEIQIPSTRTIKRHTEYNIHLISNIPELASNYLKVYKRYSEILVLHIKLSKIFPLWKTIFSKKNNFSILKQFKDKSFPKKVWFWNMNEKIIEERRQKFEEYFLFLIDFIHKNELKETEFAREVYIFFNK